MDKTDNSYFMTMGKIHTEWYFISNLYFLDEKTGTILRLIVAEINAKLVRIITFLWYLLPFSTNI